MDDPHNNSSAYSSLTNSNGDVSTTNSNGCGTMKMQETSAEEIRR